jgi:hypothetical protein
LKNITRIKSEDWFANVAPDRYVAGAGVLHEIKLHFSSEKETAMKKVFRQGGKADLNVYTLG